MKFQEQRFYSQGIAEQNNIKKKIHFFILTSFHHGRREATSKNTVY